MIIVLLSACNASNGLQNNCMSVEKDPIFMGSLFLRDTVSLGKHSAGMWSSYPMGVILIALVCFIILLVPLHNTAIMDLCTIPYV